MCRFISAILMKTGKVLVDENIDSHEDLIKKFDLKDENLLNRKWCRVELYPQNENYSIPFEEWIFKVDEVKTVDWVDEKKEKTVRIALREIYDKLVFVNKKNVIIRNQRAFCSNSIVEAFGNSTVKAFGNSTVEAYNNSTVKAYNNSIVKTYDNSTVKAYNNSIVKTYDNSTVKAWGNSTVKAYNNSIVKTYDNSTVKAYNNSIVEAYDNSTVKAWGNSTVGAYDNSIVKTYDNSIVEAYNNSIVKAWGNSIVIRENSFMCNISINDKSQKVVRNV